MQKSGYRSVSGQQLSRPDVAEISVLVAKLPLPESRETGLIRTLKGHTDSVTGVAIDRLSVDFPRPGSPSRVTSLPRGT